MRTAKFFSILFIMICTTIKNYATQIHVPSDQPTIQSGINASSDGDTVIVDAGEYFENINLKGKNILLTSHFYESFDYKEIENTIINGSMPANPDSASVILIISGEGAGCIIQGFTITGGTGTKWLDEHGAGTYREGGGILVENATPIIRYNYIQNNSVTNYTGVLSTGGGGMRCGDSNIQIYNNIIRNNYATGYGGGLVFNYCNHAYVKNNLISSNTGGEDYGGGGIWATGNEGQILEITNNTIVNNHATGSGTYGGKGGGLFYFSVTTLLTNSIVWGNTQTILNSIYINGGLMTCTYSAIEEGFMGTGNIEEDPLFMDTICFLLDTLSPCVDAGDPDEAYADIASDVMPGQAAYPSRGTLINDMGAYGGPGAQIISECMVNQPSGILHTANNHLMIYPNPATDFLILELNDAFEFELFSLNGSGVLHVTGLGKEIIDLTNIEAGIYFYKLQNLNGETKTGKLIINE